MERVGQLSGKEARAEDRGGDPGIPSAQLLASTGEIGSRRLESRSAPLKGVERVNGKGKPSRAEGGERGMDPEAGAHPGEMLAPPPGVKPIPRGAIWASVLTSVPQFPPQDYPPQGAVRRIQWVKM